MTEALTELAQREGNGWRVPSPFTMEQFGVTSPEDIIWNERGLVMQPLKTLVEPIALQPHPLPFPVSYIHCTERSMGLFDQFAARAQADGWDYHEVPLTHAAPAVAPDQCAELLMEIVGVGVSSAAV
jgi:hypothetical protein